MRQLLHTGLQWLRLAALLLTLAFGVGSAFAELESDDINAAILIEGSVVPKWENDKDHPWYLGLTGAGLDVIRTPEKEGDTAFTSTLKFTYSSEYPTELTFKWARDAYKNNDRLTVIVDGDRSWYTRSSSWVAIEPIMVEPGNHTVEFISVTEYENYSRPESYYAGVYDLRIWECKELEAACLKEGSLPLTFENDPENPWITEDGYIRSTTELIESKSSTISTTFTIDKPSLFSFEHKEGSATWAGLGINVRIDGAPYKSGFRYADWQYISFVLYPGTHTVEFEHTHSGSRYDMWSQIRNVQLDQTWLDVTLNNPGELGVRILQALGDKNLQDAELVKISGTMNSDDWAVIRQLSGVKAIDFTDANITAIPNEGCRGLSYLSTVMLPNTITEIGNLAFYNTDFHRISIPSSVQTIGWQAWDSTPLQYIDFENNSKLRKIGYRAFYDTYLMEFDMPDSVTEVGRRNALYNYSWNEDNYDEWEVLASCPRLKKVHLSNGLPVVARGAVFNCNALEEINVPEHASKIESHAYYSTNVTSIDIPETVIFIGLEAFRESKLESVIVPPSVETYRSGIFKNCKNLKDARLSSHCWNMNSTFQGCTALQKVVLPCATPPSVYSSTNEPFYGVTKANVELVVPDFAYESYKADPYWYNFTNTTTSDEASINDYWAIRGNLMLNNAHLIQGVPDIEMYSNSTITIDEGATQQFNDFKYWNDELYPTSFLSHSNDLNASRLTTYFYVNKADKWYFFAPVTDVKMSDITYPATDSWVIRYYDGARRASEDAKSGNWINVPADGMLHRGQGYIIQAKEAGWLYMPAATDADIENFLGSKEVSMELADNPCETEANAGWNFVANPYPTYYDIYYMDMQAPITVWNGSTYRAYSLNDGDRGDDTFVLRPMQPFFVQKTDADLAATMPLVGRQTNTAINRTRAPRKTTVAENRHKLNLEFLRGDAEEADDYTRIVINDAAPMKYDAMRDASKFMSIDSEVAQLYSLGEGGHPLAINERPYDNGIVDLGVYIPAAGETYRIAATRSDRKAWLYDAETGIEQDLTEGDYSFMASKTGIDNSRFSIRFAPAESAVEGAAASETEVKAGKGFITVKAPEGSVVAVYAADGRVAATATAEGAALNIPAAAGVYVVKVNGQGHKTIVK